MPTLHHTLVAGLCLAATCAIASPAVAAGHLHIYNWGEYTSPALIEKFSRLHNIAVTVDEYDSNETMLAKLRHGNPGYDVVMPGDYAVQLMIEENLLEETRPDLMSNYANVDPHYRDVYWDVGRRYTVPWAVGFTSFAVNSAAWTEEADSIALLFDPPEALKGRIAMLDDMVSIMHAAERYVGVPRCTADRDELRKVYDALMAAKPHWRTYSLDSFNRLITGEADIAQTWSGSSVVARQQLASVKFVFTKEPMEAFSDNIAVLKGAPNLENAKLFQNFMMDPENAALTSEFAGYASAITGAEAHFSEALQNAPELNVPDWVVAEFVPPCPPEVTELYNTIWTEFRR